MDADLHNFLRVVEAGTFTGAARAAHLTQPALSASIKRLEDKLGATLFERGRRGARLTSAGTALLPHARAALAATQAGRRAVAEVLGLARGEVALGAGATAAAWLLPPLLAGFERRHPGLSFRLEELATPEILERVRAGSLDLGIITRLPGVAPTPGLVEEAWREDPLVVVAAPGETREDPAWVVLHRGSPLRALTERHFPDARVVMELGSIGAIEGNVAEGLGIALVPRAAVRHALAAGRLVVRADPRTPPPRELCVVHRGAAQLSPAAAALRAALRNSGTPRTDEQPPAR